MSGRILRTLPTLPTEPALLCDLKTRAKEQWGALSQLGLRLNMARGKPASEQLGMMVPMLEWSAAKDYLAADGTDCRNYGDLAGLMEMRSLFAQILRQPLEQVVAAGNSSLELMHGVLATAMLTGTGGTAPAWGRGSQVTFLCPVPGYDRHFRICEDMGIRMVSIPMLDDGPDLELVESLVRADPSIKGMWCVPKYSNPTGAVYTPEIIRRLATMKTAARDFRLFWDNAYAVHHLTEEELEIDDVVAACAAAGYPDRAYVFTSTSKITLAGAGVAAFASSRINVKWWLERSEARTIGPDKINQLRHVRFLGDSAGLRDLMARHRRFLAPKFAAVQNVFQEELGRFGVAHWTNPRGGYFISVDLPRGCARRVVQLADQIGIALTPAGATFPYGQDPQDANIRIAPSFPPEDELVLAARGVAAAILMAVTERALTEGGAHA